MIPADRRTTGTDGVQNDGSARAADVNPAGSLPRPVVLLVDDESEMLTVLRLGIESQFEVETARSANEAELMLATRAYDVVVCDHMMPDEEGLAFLARVRTLFPKVQRILITGYVNPEFLSRSSGVAGLAACLVKPVTAPELISAIRLALPR